MTAFGGSERRCPHLLRVMPRHLQHHVCTADLLASLLTVEPALAEACPDIR